MLRRKRPRCDGTLIIHLDRTATCTNESCPAPQMVERMIDYHSMFIPCSEAFDAARCPRCVDLA